MKIKNRTNWRTDDIRKLINACFKLELISSGSYLILIENRRRGSGLHGQGLYHRKWIRLLLPIDGDKDNKIDVVRLAHTIRHEIAHTQNLRHRQMTGTKAYGYPDGWQEFYSWAVAYEIRKKPTLVPKSKPDIRKVRYERALANLKKAETRLKRAKTLHKKWKDKIVYYERKQNETLSRNK